MEPSYFYIDSRGMRSGPMTEAELVRLAEVGGIDWSGSVELDGHERRWKVSEVGWLADAMVRRRSNGGAVPQPPDAAASQAAGPLTPAVPVTPAVPLTAAVPLMPAVPPTAPQLVPAAPASARPACSRSSYILLALLPALLGVFGIHNIVAGYTGRGIAQLALSILTIGGPVALTVGVIIAPPCCCIGVPVWSVLLVWTLVEVATTTRDARGVEMA